MTGYSRTKVNRCLAEGRERFRAFLTRSESGDRCAEMWPALSAFCDGEASVEDADALREHLRVCAHCRAAMRAYRAAPRAVAVLAPAPIVARPLLERAQEALSAMHARLPGRGGGLADTSISQVAAAGGARGAGTAALAKMLAICAGAAGGAAVCVSAGVVPAPLDLAPDREVRPHLERSAAEPAPAVESAPAPTAEPEPVVEGPPSEPVASPPPPEVAPSSEAVAVPAEPAPAPTSSGAAATRATAESAAGEFGP